MTSEEAMLADVNNAVEDLHTKVNALAIDVNRLAATLEKLADMVDELMPAARRAVKMMDNSKTVKVMEMVKSATRRG